MPIITAVLAFLIFVFGFYIGSSFVTDSIRESCIKDNPSIPVGEIKKYCNNRLYLKDKND